MTISQIICANPVVPIRSCTGWPRRWMRPGSMSMIAVRHQSATSLPSLMSRPLLRRVSISLGAIAQRGRIAGAVRAQSAGGGVATDGRAPSISAPMRMRSMARPRPARPRTARAGRARDLRVRQGSRARSSPRPAGTPIAFSSSPSRGGARGQHGFQLRASGAGGCACGPRAWHNRVVQQVVAAQVAGERLPLLVLVGGDVQQPIGALKRARRGGGRVLVALGSGVTPPIRWFDTTQPIVASTESSIGTSMKARRAGWRSAPRRSPWRRSARPPCRPAGSRRAAARCRRRP